VDALAPIDTGLDLLASSDQVRAIRASNGRGLFRFYGIGREAVRDAREAHIIPPLALGASESEMSGGEYAPANERRYSSGTGREACANAAARRPMRPNFGSEPAQFSAWDCFAVFSPVLLSARCCGFMRPNATIQPPAR
jgi:hypothetical protein